MIDKSFVHLKHAMFYYIFKFVYPTEKKLKRFLPQNCMIWSRSCEL